MFQRCFRPRDKKSVISDLSFFCMTPSDVQDKNPLRPVLSVILPTKNRSRYAISTITGILSWQDDDFELVVQDNSDTEDLAMAVASIDDPRLRYCHATDSLDMEANFARATLNARGRYLAFIGDDDGLTEEVVDVARWAGAQNIEAVFPSGKASFLWPDVVSGFFGTRFSGILRIGRFSGRISHQIGDEEIRKCLRSAGQDFHNLPRAYFGLVRRDCLDKVREKCGSFFPGPSPDLSGAIAIASIAEKLVEIDYPIFIYGTGARSVGGLGVAKRHVGRLEDWPHLPKWSISQWSPLVPRLFLGQTIWAEDAIQALKAMKRTDLLPEFNTALLHAMCTCFHPAYSQPTMDNFWRQWRLPTTPRLLWLIRFAVGYMYSWELRLVSLARNLCALASIGPETLIREIEDSQTAMTALSRYLREQNVSFLKCIDR